MKKLLLCALMFLSLSSLAQPLDYYAVMLEARPQETPLAIHLSWKSDPGATSYTLFRKTRQDSVWGASIASIAVSDTSFTDTSINPGKEYEYRLIKLNATAGQKIGYAECAVRGADNSQRGLMILIVDSILQANLSAEIIQLEWDLVSSGWGIKKLVVAPSENVASVKQKIIIINQLYPNQVKTIFLLGDIAVPYSGQMNPDGHPDHIGAWPADAYYGDMDESEWTDNVVNDQSASRAANHNVPGDGKFDQSILPTKVEAVVGRVDLSNMPAFGSDYVELTRRYLQKAHNYKHYITEVRMRAVIDNNFGPVAYPEVFAGSGMRSFSSLLESDSILYDDYFTTLKQPGGAILSYGTGGGTYTSAGGIGSSTDYLDSSINTVFTMTFGSYFGDWDNANNFLRAPLASPGNGLANVWAGRPHISLHRLGSGLSIGEAMLVNMNNNNIYVPGYFVRGVHTGLMGDPSLTLHRVKPPGKLTVTEVPTIPGHPWVQLRWQPSPQAVDGYKIFVSDNRYGPFHALSSQIITDTFYMDTNPGNGSSYYIVEAVKWNTFPSQYPVLSQGSYDSISLFVAVSAAKINSPSVRIYPLPANDHFIIETDQSINSVTLTDINGKLVQVWENLEGDTIQKLELQPGLSNGVYFVRMGSGNQQFTSKLVIMR